MPDHPSFVQRFGKEPPNENQIICAYTSFISDLRKVYPEANIICALGSMDATMEGSKWPGYVKSAVQNLNDDKMFLISFDFINKPGHPRVVDNKVMAQRLIEFIENNLDW